LCAVPLRTEPRGTAYLVTGEIPAARVHQLQQGLAPITRGEGVLVSAFERYEPVRGPVPSRPRTDHDPLDRRTYLLRVARRASAG
jgi:ribosomal protection tetracycline resistance protein